MGYGEGTIIKTTKQSFTQSGFTLLEVSIASAVLVTSVLVVSSMIANSKKNTVGLQGLSLCRTRAQMLVQSFKNADNKASISNWVATTSALPTISPHPELGMFPIVSSATGRPLAPGATLNPGVTNGWELIEGGTNWALSLVKNNIAYCAAATASTPPGKLLTTADTASFAVYNGNKLMLPTSNLINEKEYLSVQLVSSAGVVQPCTAGGFNPIIPIGPNTSGLPQQSVLLTATITFNDENNRLLSCDASTKLKPDGNSIPPSFINPTLVPNPLAPAATASCGASPSLMCLSSGGNRIVPPSGTNPRIACDSSAVSILFQVNEAATVFGCDIQYATTEAGLGAALPVPPFTLCANNTAFPVRGLSNGVNLAITPYTGSSVNGSGAMANLSATSLQDGFYRFYVKAYDAARNTAVQYIDFGVDNTRPTSVTMVPPTPLLARFNAYPAATRGHLPVGAPWSTAVNFGPQLFQCQDSVPTDVWSVSEGSEPVGVTAAGAAWAYSFNGGAQVPIPAASPCSSSIPTPTGLASGSYTMYAYACDECGAVTTPSASVTWTVDVAAAPSTGHTPTTLPAANFNTSSLLNFALNVAKPAPLPYEYACQNVSGSFSSQVSSCSPTTPPSTCSAQGSKGFCTASYDGCGRGTSDLNTPYAVAAGAGESCCNVACRNDLNLVCDMDNSPSRGTCIATKPCARDADCGGGSSFCYTTTGTCYGASVGPAPQTCSASVIP